MSEIRNLTRNGETFYPLTHIDGIIDRDGSGLVINDIFDISEYNASDDPPVLQEYSNLSSALSGIPLEKQKPGMTIRFIESTNHSYLQYRLISSTWSTNTDDWASMNIDDEPITGSNNLVKSGGVLDSVIRDGSAFDLSSYTGDSYASLSAALTAMSGLPAAYKMGGMSIKFIQSSDNKYVQYIYIGTSTSVNDFKNISNWDKINIDKELIKLTGIGSDASQIIHSVGEIMYNNKTHLLRQCVNINPLTLVTIPFYDGAIYTYSNNLYVWNGSDLVLANDFVSVGSEPSGVEDAESISIKGNIYNIRDAKAPLIVDSYSCFAIEDERQNVILKLKDGDIKTKNFDSSKDATPEERGLMSSVDKAKLNTVEEGAEANDITTDDAEDEDLDISDEQGNVLVRFKDGYIKTKNFDSSALKLNQTDRDFSILDDKGNAVMIINGGDIKTKNFDSKKVSLKKRIDTITLTSVYKTDIVATSRNYIIRDDGVNLYISNDLGMSYNTVPHNGSVEIGNVAFVHFFRDGRILLCDNERCFYSDDLFSTINVSNIYDYDGSAFVASSRNHFFRLGNYNSEYHVINNTEVLAWNDYANSNSYASRVWYTDDKGETIKCILKKGETLDTDGNLIDPTHFHRTFIDDITSTIYVTSGDTEQSTRLLRGSFNGNIWQWDVIGQGMNYKFGQLTIKDGTAYCITDYTDNVRDTGIIICPANKLSNYANFSYLYKTDNKNPVSSYFEDSVGNRCIFPDAIGYKKFWYAKGNFKFRQISIAEDNGENWAPICLLGPNYNGEAIILASHGYSTGNYNLSQRDKFRFAKSMRDAGFEDFCNQINII